MRLPLPMLASLALAGPSTAQSIDVKWIAETELRCEYSVFLVGKFEDKLPPQSDLAGGFSLSIYGATMRGTLATEPTRIVATIDERCLKTGGPIRHAQVGSHDTLLTLRSARPVSAILRLTAISVGHAAPFNAFDGSQAIDIGADDKVELVGQLGLKVSADYPVRIDSTGLRVRTRTYGRAWDFNSTLTAFYQGMVMIEILPDACVVVPYGRICDLDPPSLAAAPTFGGGLELRVGGAPASTIGKHVFGTRSLELRLPGGLCWLNTDVLMTLPVVTDALGEARVELPLPRDPRLSFQVQSVLLAKTATGLPLLATNALRVVCR